MNAEPVENGHGGDEFADDVRGLVKAELEPGERLLWAAPPVLRPFRIGGGVVFASVAAFGSLAVACVAFTQSVRSRPDDVGGMVLAMFAFLVGFFLSLVVLSSLNRRRSERAAAAGILYALTDRRAIFWVPERSSNGVRIVTVPRGSVTGVHRVQFPDGSGDVRFRFKDVEYPFGYDAFFLNPTGFRGVSDVQRVEEMVRRTLVIPTEGASNRSQRSAGGDE